MGGEAVNKASDAMKQGQVMEPLDVMIQKSVKEIGQTLPRHLSPERLVRIALTAVRLNPELTKCTPASFMGSLFVLAQMGLEPIAGRAYILPYKTRRKTASGWIDVSEAQAIIGYKGLVDLFYRHESALTIDAHEVRQNDDFAYEYGSASFLRHRPASGDRGEIIGYYAVAQIKGGGAIFRYMTQQEAMDHGKKHSKTWVTEEWDDQKKIKVKLEHPHFIKASPWAREPEAMCKKTVLIQLAKFLPLSVEMQRAIEVDETSREYREGITNMADLPVTTEWEEPQSIEAQPEQRPLPTVEVIEVDPLIGKLNRFKENHAKAKVLGQAIGIHVAKIGKEKFLEILGTFGCTKGEEIQTIDDLSKFANACSDEAKVMSN